MMKNVIFFIFFIYLFLNEMCLSPVNKPSNPQKSLFFVVVVFFRLNLNIP